MTVKELKAMLENYPDDMGVIYTCYSDYSHIDEEMWSVVEAVDHGNYIMRSHPTMSEENKAKAKMYLHLVGN